MIKVFVVNVLLMSMFCVSGKRDPIRLPDFPDSLGIAGAFMGVSNGAVIVAGGSQFEKPQWNDGTKQVLDGIWVLCKDAGEYKWKYAGKLPFHVSNGASVTVPQGVICIGGATDTAESDAVLLLTWDTVRRTIRIKQLPSLPQPCAYLSAIAQEEQVMVAGGRNSDSPDGMDNWWMLDLRPASPQHWQSLGLLPSPRFGAIFAFLRDGNRRYVVLGSGKSENNYLTDLYRCSLDDKAGTWGRLRAMPRAALVAPRVSTGGSAMWVLGGSDGVNIANRLALRNEYHLNETILKYDMRTDSWTVVGTLPEGIAATRALPWENGVLLVGGELGNAMRSPKVWLYNELITKNEENRRIDSSSVFNAER